MELSKIIESMKGISGSGNALSEFTKNMAGFLATLEPGDIVRSDPPQVSAAPLAPDLWYLWCHENLMKLFYDGIDGDHFDYSPYLAANLSFIALLPGLKPLKVLRDLEKQLSPDTHFDIDTIAMRTQWANNGIYWINTMAFELWGSGQGAQYASDGPKDFTPNDYVGYLTFPIGQIGVMEVLSLIQETGLSGYVFSAVDSLATYHVKPQVVLTDQEKPTLQFTPEMFPDMKDSNGNALSGQNFCYGRHLIESAYLVPTEPEESQNKLNSSEGTAYAPVPSRDVELFSSPIKDYPEDVRPKKWMRYWIRKDSTLPVPGEFIGILCRPVSCPPHVWWFQESSPFLYAGNWVETGNLTSGVITAVTPEASRTDGGIGSQYTVKVQGCEIIIDATDFFEYAVGDRVAVLKVNSTAAVAAKSFTWLDQTPLKSTDNLTVKANYVIIPATFYKVIH